MRINRAHLPGSDRPNQRFTAAAELVDSARGQGGLVWRNWRSRVLLALHDGSGRSGAWSALSLTRSNLVGLVMKLVQRTARARARQGACRDDAQQAELF